MESLKVVGLVIVVLIVSYLGAKNDYLNVLVKGFYQLVKVLTKTK